MAITLGECPESLDLSQSVRDGLLESTLTRKFVVQGANDPTVTAVLNLGALVGDGWFGPTSVTLSAAITTAGGARTTLPVRALPFAVGNGATMKIGAAGGTTQNVTLSVAAAIGDTTITVSSFTPSVNFPARTPVTVGTTAPSNSLDIYCINRRFTPRAQADMTNAPVLDLTLTYGPPWRIPQENTPTADGGSGTPKLEWDIQEENVHIDHALDATHYGSSGASDPGLVIGVKPDGTVDGVDRPYGVTLVKMKMRHRTFTAAYQDDLEELVGCVNVATFHGYAAGRLRFKGATAEQREEGYYEVTYLFEKRTSRVVSIDIYGLGPTDVTIPAHHYLWVSVKQVSNGSGGLMHVIQHAHVDEIYEQGDFTGIDFNH